MTPAEGLARYRDVLDPANGPSYRVSTPCAEDNCTEPAGTAWSKYWCPRHNAERMDHISASLDALAATPAAKPEDE